MVIMEAVAVVIAIEIAATWALFLYEAMKGVAKL